MRSRLVSLLLAALLLVPALPVGAADPDTSPRAGTTEQEPAPPPSPDATEPDDLVEPTPTATPDPAASPEPTELPADDLPPLRSDVASTGGLSARERYIVLLAPGTDVAAAAAQHGRRFGVRPERVFSSVRGFSAALTPAQRRALEADPAVDAIVPDEIIEVASQVIPSGVSRIGGRTSIMATINGTDQRIDADVAIVDTGIDGTHPDLNVVGGYNCTTSDRSAWRDVHGHGTHVAGTVGAIDNDFGVVGVAPGVRLWAVRILNDKGAGLLSWYVCGLDWITAQRDPQNSARPLFEAVNMSVAKWGADDGNCGNSTNDILHRAICRMAASGITVVVAAGNDSGNAAKRVPAAYDQVITVSALADTDGRPGGLGGNRCWSCGGYDQDDTFADFSNYGHDIDLIAPGKCIWSTMPGNAYAFMSGTSMATPAVTGAVALYKATRPWATPAEVRAALRYLGNHDWDTSTDPDGDPEPLLAIQRIGPWGDFTVGLGGDLPTVDERGGTFSLPVAVSRSSTFFERVTLTATADGGIRASVDRPSLYGFEETSATLTVTVPRSTPAGTYTITVVGTEHGRSRSFSRSVVVENDLPAASPPTVDMLPNTALSGLTVTARVSWPAGSDPSSPIAGYQHQTSVDGGPWGATGSTASVRSFDLRLSFGRTYRFRVRACDAAGNWSSWAEGSPVRVDAVQDNSSAVRYAGAWTRIRNTYASGGTLTYASRTGSSARVTVTGRQVALITPVSATRGTARIYVDGVHVANVSTSSSTSASRRVVWVGTFASAGSRTIEVRLYGGRRVDIDAFLVLS
jgi:subtilisin